MLDLYRIFEEVVNSGSIQRAASNLNYSASGVSYAIKRLEEYFGMKLLIREKKGVTMTSNGKQLRPLFKKIVEMQEGIESEANLIKGKSTGTVHLGTLLSASSTWIPHTISRFKNEYPLVEIKVMQGTYDELNTALISGDVDISFLRSPVNERLQSYIEILDPLFCATPKSFVPINNTYITTEDLQNKNFVIAKELFLYDVEAYFSENNISYNLDYTINSDYTNLIMVESGIGFSLFPYMFLKRQLANVNIFPIQNGPLRKLAISAQREEYLSPATQAMLVEFKKYWQLEASILRDLYSNLYPELKNCEG